ncbi:MAG: DUF294 nucleotidyltransferase-like domain-containing protein [Pseudomonadota bacterium]
MPLPPPLSSFLASVHPYDSLPAAGLAELVELCVARDYAPGDQVFGIGDALDSLYVIAEGEVEITDDTGVQLSILGPRNSFGERALLRGESASRTAIVSQAATMIVVPAGQFFQLIKDYASVAKFFDRRRQGTERSVELATRPVRDLMTKTPVSVAPAAPIKEAATLMRDRRISAICVEDDARFRGIVTLRDMTARVVVEGEPPSGPVARIMTEDPLTLGPDALVSDVLHLMVERRVGHVPIVDRDHQLLGIVTQTDLTRAQALSSADIVWRVTRAGSAAEMAQATADIPALLAQLVDAGHRHEVVTKLITDIADTATRRLIALAQAQLGPAPGRFLWLACGSQGRQEQTGVSDQDNCIIYSDWVKEADRPYFAALARFVCDGLDQIGYVYCPGDMMATAPRWCQPLRVWESYFEGWIAKPDAEAQMLASVMFDLRPIGGDETLFEGLQAKVLKAAAANSIFTAHLVSNSLKHQPPLGLLRGLATIRSGEHRNELDLKHNGVVPIVDLGRIYTLQGRLTPANTRARIVAGIKAGVVSASGGADLLDAYDTIATARLEHQAAQIRAGGRPTNYLDPTSLSDFERSHLRDAFVVVKTMQSAAGSGQGAIG